MAVSDAVREEWRPVVGYEEYYHVSNHGRVKRMAGGSNRAKIGRVLKPYKCGWGYLQVDLSVLGVGSQQLVHVLVSAAFIGPKTGEVETNHKDGDKTNNGLSNLEYVTKSENILHSYRTGLRKAVRGESSGMSKLKESEVFEVRDLIKYGFNLKTIGDWYGVVKTAIMAIKSGQNWGWLT